MRRPLLIAAAVLIAPIVFLGVEVLIARSGERLDDEIGFRPEDLTVRPGSGPTSVVWLGDSTSSGVGAAEVEQSMAHRVAAEVADGPVSLTIIGVSGAQVHEVVDDQLPQLAARVASGDPVDVVFVSIGANDVTALTLRSTFRDRYEELVRELRRLTPDAEIVLVGVPDMGTAPRIPEPLRQLAGARAAQLDAEIEAIAESEDLHHVDLAERTGGIFASDPDRYFSADDFHPAPDGHEVWADAVIASLRDAGSDVLGPAGNGTTAG